MLATTHKELECIIGTLPNSLAGKKLGYRVVVQRFPHWTFYVDAETADDAVRIVHAELDRDGIPYMSGKNGSETQRI